MDIANVYRGNTVNNGMESDLYIYVYTLNSKENINDVRIHLSYIDFKLLN